MTLKFREVEILAYEESWRCHMSPCQNPGTQVGTLLVEAHSEGMVCVELDQDGHARDCRCAGRRTQVFTKLSLALRGS